MKLKSSIVALAAALAAISTSAPAENAVPAKHAAAVKLSDAELDQITAGNGAMSSVVVFNPGNADTGIKFNGHGNHVTCINCDLGITPPEGTSGVVGVLTPNGKLIVHPIRQMPF